MKFCTQTRLSSSPDPISCLWYSIPAYLVPLRACAYSRVLILCFLCYPVSPLPVHITLLCSVPHFRYPHPNAMSLDSIYKTLIHVCIQHVQISTLTIVLIVYLTLGHSQTSLSNFHNLPTLFCASGNLALI